MTSTTTLTAHSGRGEQRPKAAANVAVASITLVIPAHNEVENIPGVLRNSRQVLQQICDNWEILLVDDASHDGTADAAKRALGDDARRHLTIVQHRRQRGYGITVRDGLSRGRGELLAFMDGDGQFDPADLLLLLEHMGDADLVTGRRLHRADPWHRSVVSGTFNILVRSIYGVHLRDVDCGLKVMRREVFSDAQPILARSALMNTEIFFKTRRNGYRIVQVGIAHYPRTAGRRSGGRLIPILRAVRDLMRLRVQLAQTWIPPRSSSR